MCPFSKSQQVLYHSTLPTMTPAALTIGHPWIQWCLPLRTAVLAIRCVNHLAAYIPTTQPPQPHYSATTAPLLSHHIPTTQPPHPHYSESPFFHPIPPSLLHTVSSVYGEKSAKTCIIRVQTQDNMLYNQYEGIYMTLYRQLSSCLCVIWGAGCALVTNSKDFLSIQYIYIENTIESLDRCTVYVIQNSLVGKWEERFLSNFNKIYVQYIP